MLVDIVVVGILGGILYAISGYLKSYYKEKFDIKKFLRTLIIGLMASFALAFSGFEITLDAIDVLVASGTTAVIEQLILSIYRYFRGGG